MVNIIIADSHEIIREGIAQCLIRECGANVVGQAEDGYTVIKQVRSLECDILIMDLGLMRPSGIDTFKKLRTIKPDLKILALSSDSSTSDAFTMLGLGAVGFMPKQAKGEHFVNAIKSIQAGYTFMPHEYLQDFTELRRNVSRSGNIFGLSPRELEVLEACATGDNTKQVAAKLCISVRTVETHRNAIYRKADCRGLKDLGDVIERM